jgi:hypothetical protein
MPPEDVQSSRFSGIAGRIRRAAERILEDESLTADLDDDAAQVLLDWGVALAEGAARHAEVPPAGQESASAGVQESEDPLAVRLASIRRLLRRVQRWAAEPEDPDPQAQSELWQRVQEAAADVYGAPAALQAQSETRLASAPAATPAQRVARVRALVEGVAGDPDPSTDEPVERPLWLEKWRGDAPAEDVGDQGKDRRG